MNTVNQMHPLQWGFPFLPEYFKKEYLKKNFQIEFETIFWRTSQNFVKPQLFTDLVI